jgi:hypothetical protein
MTVRVWVFRLTLLAAMIVVSAANAGWKWDGAAHP